MVNHELVIIVKQQTADYMQYIKVKYVYMYLYTFKNILLRSTQYAYAATVNDRHRL